MYYRLSIVSTNKINYDKLKILNHDSNISTIIMETKFKAASFFYF